MTRVVINKCFGGFSLSNAAVQRYGELAGLNLVSKDRGYYNQWYIDSVDEVRTDEEFFCANFRSIDENVKRIELFVR